jgi:ribonucleotide reductase beta subunit family protein with ferritin-like domain
LFRIRFSAAGYPIRVKKKIAELENECTRYEEEIGILETEMKNFIKYYRNNVIRRIKAEEAKLLPHLNNGE